MSALSSIEGQKSRPAKPKPPNKYSMRKSAISLVAMMIFCVLYTHHHQLQAQTHPMALKAGGAWGRTTEQVNEKNLEERKRQLTAIETAFARYTRPERAKLLAKLCYDKTSDTLFTPMDLAEIALAETGGHGLSAKAVSVKGAVGVWQLMPFRARSHGYSPEEMLNDEKCAEAAVRELASKLEMARGNISRAKKLYCGVGREADAYEVKRRRYRKEIMEEMDNAVQRQAEIEAKEDARSS